MCIVAALVFSVRSENRKAFFLTAVSGSLESLVTLLTPINWGVQIQACTGTDPIHR